MNPWRKQLAGTLGEFTIASEVLKGNPLGDPHERPLWVYTPPGTTGPLPVIYEIQGLTGQIEMWWNRDPFRDTFIETMDAMFAAGDSPPAIVAFVDCWTSLGGSQFLDSPGTGNYLTYLCDEVVPWVDERFNTLAGRDHRGIAGKSSGGYGAMVLPMLRPDIWGGLATHAGDALFETCYLPEFREAARALRDEYDGSYEKFWAEFRGRPAFGRKSDGALLNEWCMAACYSTDPDGTVRLPFDTVTGELIDEVWERWLALDPVRMVPKNVETIRSLRAIYIDAGKHDEYYLDLGAEAFRRAVEAAGAPDVRFELFDAGHGGINYRYHLAVRYLAERLG